MKLLALSINANFVRALIPHLSPVALLVQGAGRAAPPCRFLNKDKNSAGSHYYDV